MNSPFCQNYHRDSPPGHNYFNECVLQKSNKPYKKPCGLDCSSNNPNFTTIWRS